MEDRRYQCCVECACNWKVEYQMISGLRNCPADEISKGECNMGSNNEKAKTSQQQKEKQYQQHVEKVTPKYSLALRMLKAFIVGGIICLIGQCIINYATNSMGIDKETAGSWCSMLLVLSSVLLTGFNIYPKLVEWGGAGALVPITGFANSIASAAIEYQKEGQVFGIGCKIFTIAGPVILYGIVTSWALGVIYWITTLF